MSQTLPSQPTYIYNILDRLEKEDPKKYPKKKSDALSLIFACDMFLRSSCVIRLGRKDHQGLVGALEMVRAKYQDNPEIKEALDQVSVNKIGRMNKRAKKAFIRGLAQRFDILQPPLPPAPSVDVGIIEVMYDLTWWGERPSLECLKAFVIHFLNNGGETPMAQPMLDLVLDKCEYASVHIKENLELISGEAIRGLPQTAKDELMTKLSKF